jgi:hypothetical protein
MVFQVTSNTAHGHAGTADGGLESWRQKPLPRAMQSYKWMLATVCTMLDGVVQVRERLSAHAFQVNASPIHAPCARSREFFAPVDPYLFWLDPDQVEDVHQAIGEDDSQGDDPHGRTADNDNLFRFVHELLSASFWLRLIVELQTPKDDSGCTLFLRQYELVRGPNRGETKVRQFPLTVRLLG